MIETNGFTIDLSSLYEVNKSLLSSYVFFLFSRWPASKFYYMMSDLSCKSLQVFAFFENMGELMCANNYFQLLYDFIKAIRIK